MMMFSQFKLTLTRLKEPKERWVDILYVSFFVHQLVSITSSSYKIYSFIPGESFLMTGLCLFWELKVLGVQLKMEYKKVSFLSKFSLMGRFILHKYIKNRERKVQVTLPQVKALLCATCSRLSGVSEFTKTFIRTLWCFIFWETVLFLYSINIFFRFNWLSDWRNFLLLVQKHRKESRTYKLRNERALIFIFHM